MNKVAKNFLYNLSYQILFTVVPFITIPYLSRVLGADNIGINGVVESVIAMFTLFGLLGSNMYAQREIAYNSANEKDRNRTFYEILCMRLVLLALTTIIYAVFAWNSRYGKYYLIQYMVLAGNFLDISWYFIGCEDMRPVAIRNYFVKILFTIGVFTLVRHHSDLGIYMGINGVSILLSSLCMFPRALLQVGRVKISSLHMKKHILPTLALLLPQATSQLYMQFDKVMIDMLTSSTKEVAYYTQNEKLVKVPLIFDTALSTVLMPRMAAEFVKNKVSAITSYMEKAFILLSMIEVHCMFGLMGLANRLIPWFLGDEFASSYPLTILMSVIILPMTLAYVTGVQYLTAANKVKVMTSSYAAGAIMNIILNAICIPGLGAYGAALGTIAAEYAVFVVQYRYIRKHLAKLHFVRPLLRYIFAGAVMAVCVYLLGLVLPLGLLGILVQIVCGVIVYIVLLLILRDKTLIRMIRTRSIIDIE